MKKIKGKNIKNKIILGVITVLLMLINLIIIKFFVDNKKSIFITWGILTVFFLIYRLLIFIIQKILIKINVLKYIPDYFANDEFKKLREKLNVEHQQAEDRIFLALVYNISFIILMTIFIKFLNKAKGSNQDKRNLTFITSVLFGIIFSLSWTPCVGAFLSSALIMASTTGSVLKGASLLLIYSLGLAIPFIITTLFLEKMKKTFDFIKKHYNIINKICGSILVLSGLWYLISGIIEIIK